MQEAAEVKYREAIALNPERPFAWANLVPSPQTQFSNSGLVSQAVTPDPLKLTHLYPFAWANLVPSPLRVQ